MFRYLSLMLCLATPALADFDGQVRAYDGDGIYVGDTKVRLFGIDAPELTQMCTGANGQAYPCGELSYAALAQMFDGAWATCEGFDQSYDRIVARCWVDGQDIAQEMVLAGWAEAYREFSMDYDLAEKTAQVRGVGIWGGSFQSPSAYRADQRSAQAQANAPTGECIIKGNISGSGRIYHMPHNENYANTRINEGRGERWFCTEAEARAAGWRAARN